MYVKVSERSINLKLIKPEFNQWTYFIVSFPLNRIVIYAVDIIFLFLKSLKNLLSEADSSGR